MPGPSTLLPTLLPPSRWRAALLSATCCLVSVLMPTAAQAQPRDPTERHTALLAASCMACHGTDGRADGAALTLAGRPETKLFADLMAFKTDQRIGTVMNKHAKGYSDDELRRMARWFSQVR
jgi:cytochrome subunit of sulfide dehydrogenase